MTEQFFKDPKVRRSLHCGPLDPHVDGFAEVLFEQGYAATTAKQKLLLISELSHWLKRHHQAVEDVSESRSETFLRYRKDKKRLHHGDPPTLMQFLSFLRQAGVIPNLIPEIDDSPVQRIENSFNPNPDNCAIAKRGLRSSPTDQLIYGLPFTNNFIILPSSIK